MNIKTCALALTLLVGLAPFTVAQEDEPKELTAEEKLEARAAEAAEALRQRQAKAIERERLAPVIDAIAETRPTSPVELINTIESLVNLNQPEEAKKYITQLLALKLNPEAYFVLHRKVGSGIFFRLLTNKEYHPEGLKLAEDVLKAAHQQARDPKRMAQLVGELSDPAPEVRASALADLKDAGEGAIGPLVAVLTDPTREKEHAAVAHALAQLGELGVEPMIAMAQSPDTKLRAQAIEILGYLGSARAAPHMIYPLMSSREPRDVRLAAAAALQHIIGVVPGEADAKTYLYQRALAHFTGTLPKKADNDNNIALWVWDQEKHQPVPALYRAGDAALVVGAQLSSDLYALWPNEKKHSQLYLAANLEAAKVVGGLDRSLPREKGGPRDLAAQLGVDAIEDVLVFAMENQRIPAAIGAVEVLGDIGSPALLDASGLVERPLVKALTYPNRRLQFAAAEAIVKIDPTGDYVGSSLLPKTLGFLAGTVGERRVLIGHYSKSTAQSLVGMLLQMGYQAETATTGRALLAQAATSPDYELILVSDAINHPPLNETLQALRNDVNTSSLPIGVMAREDRLNRLQLRVSEDPLTEAFPRPHNSAGLQFQIGRLMTRLDRDYVPPHERLRHGSAALSWLAKYAEDRERYGFYDVSSQAPSVARSLFGGYLADRAAEVLGLLGTPEAQLALVDFASQTARPLKARQAAASAFEVAVQARGVMLLNAAVDQQYERYNQSESLDVGTQQVLAQILDTIESPHAEVPQPE